MSEAIDWGEQDQQGQQGLDPVSKSIARRRRRLNADETHLNRLRARVERPATTEEELKQREADLNQILVLEERLGTSGMDPYAAARAEEAYDPEDAVPTWLRAQWDRAARSGAAVLALPVESLHTPAPEAA